LQATGDGSRESALDESLAGLALVAQSEFSVDGLCAERAFGGVAGRLDVLDGGPGSVPAS
jgi:hypothetical protein